MASNCTVEKVYTDKNKICCINPRKVYLIAENMCLVVTFQMVLNRFSDFGTHLLQNEERYLLTMQP